MRLSFRIYGKVQGIGFRWFVKERAASRRISGWVRNAADGAVEGEAQGAVPDIDVFLKDIKTGHPLASVSEIDSQEMLDVDGGEAFKIEPSECVGT